MLVMLMFAGAQAHADRVVFRFNGGEWSHSRHAGWHRYWGGPSIGFYYAPTPVYIVPGYDEPSYYSGPDFWYSDPSFGLRLDFGGGGYYGRSYSDDRYYGHDRYDNGDRYDSHDRYNQGDRNYSRDRYNNGSHNYSRDRYDNGDRYSGGNRYYGGGNRYSGGDRYSGGGNHYSGGARYGNSFHSQGGQEGHGSFRGERGR